MTTSKDVSSFRTTATSLQVTAETAIGKLNTAIAATKQRIQDEQSQVAQLETDMQNIQNQIAQLQQQMSGSDEFWQAFAEGLSLGIYHPIEDDINQQRDLYQQAVEKRQNVRSDLAAIQIEHRPPVTGQPVAHVGRRPGRQHDHARKRHGANLGPCRQDRA